MGAVTPGETLGTLYNIHVGSNKTKQHCRTYEKAVSGGREREKGGHVLRDTTSRGLCGRVGPPRTTRACTCGMATVLLCFISTDAAGI